MIVQEEMFNETRNVELTEYGLRNLSAAILRRTYEDARITKFKHVKRTSDLGNLCDLRRSVDEFIHSSLAQEMCDWLNFDYKNFVEKCEA